MACQLWLPSAELSWQLKRGPREGVWQWPELPRAGLAYQARVASGVGTSREGEAMILLSYVRGLAQQPGV